LPLQPSLGHDPPGPDGVRQRLVVVLVLVGVGLCELTERHVEGRTGAEVGRDRDAVPGAGVRAGECPPAQFDDPPV